MMFKMMNMSFEMNKSNSMMNMNKLMDMMMIMMLMILTLILIMMMLNNKNKKIMKSMFENQKMEIMWTIFPMLMITFMSLYSISVLYMNNEIKMSSMSIKIIGNQWFWNYNYLNFNIKFNSYLMYKMNFDFNIMETDNKMVIPFNTNISLIVSSMDVIHSWYMPSLNIKIDAIPNQLNLNTMKTNKISIMYGQCSEICGINHSFMPISMESILMKNFIYWMKNMFLENLFMKY